MKTIIIINQKGGTGKTTTAVNIAAGLYRSGFKTLLIDLDPQGNASTASGTTPDESTPGTYEILKSRITAQECILTSPNGYDIITTDIRQSGADLELITEPGRDFILSNALKSINHLYDYAIIDSPPNLSITTIQGLTAADEVLITLKADFLALNGVAQLKDTIEIVKARLNPDLKIAGVLLTFFDGRKKLDNQITDMAAAAFPGKVFKSKIGNYVALAEAPAFSSDIFRYAPGSKAAAQYEELTQEIINLSAE